MTDVGAVAATLADGEEGRVVPPGRPELLAAALATYLDDSGAAARAGHAARRRVERDFSSAAVARRHLEDYSACLLRKGRSAGKAAA